LLRPEVQGTLSKPIFGGEEIAIASPQRAGVI